MVYSYILVKTGSFPLQSLIRFVVMGSDSTTVLKTKFSSGAAVFGSSTGNLLNISVLALCSEVRYSICQAYPYNNNNFQR